MGAVMGSFVDSRMNFVTGSAMMEQNRAELYVDDQVGGGGGGWGGGTTRCGRGAISRMAYLLRCAVSVWTDEAGGGGEALGPNG